MALNRATAPKGTRSSRLRPVMPHRDKAAQIRALTWHSNILRQDIGRRTAFLRAVLRHMVRLPRVKKIRTIPHAVSRE
jgi:hypothetical protein